MRALSVGANLVANTLTTLYTVPKGYYARVMLLRAVNTGSLKHISFDWFDSSVSLTYSLVYQTTLSTKTTQDWGGTSYFVMEEGDILKATSEAASTFSVVITIEEEGLTRT
jgi:hypothetical protein